MSFVRKLWRFFLWSSTIFSLFLWIVACIFWVRGFWFYDTAGIRMSGATLELYSAGRFGVRHDTYDPPWTLPPGTSRLAFFSFPILAFPLNHGYGAFSEHHFVAPARPGAPRHSIQQFEMSSELLVLLAAIWPSIFLPVAFWRRRRRGPQGGFPVELKAS